VNLGVKLFKGYQVLPDGVWVLMGIGDFNLAFLDLIKEVDGLKWSGNCNELNAAYSADGMHTRIFQELIVKDTRVLLIPLDVLLPLLGLPSLRSLRVNNSVGELSAAAGIAGSYCEYVYTFLRLR
jgi:hypothetical protein